MADVLELPELDSLLDGIVGVCANPQAQEPLRKAIEEWTGELGRGMAAGKSPDGTPFAPLDPDYKRTRENQGGPPLTNLGDMLMSLLSDGSGHIEEIGDDEATLGSLHNKNGSDPPVSVVHQLGSPTMNIPARPWIGVNEAMAEIAAERIGEHIERRLAAL